ncbi:MAG: bluetail domain-containing putative surface protein [Pseudohongiella sp.]|uniref:bluetail domain-containing putative surface protein n=1 Tax=Pseudohongiella sp. TaxID=1979412 RepID=UPI0034A08237
MATQETRAELIEIVVAMFDAAPGVAVLSDLTAASDLGNSNALIAVSLANSAEFKSIFPTFMTNAEFVSDFVDQMVGTLVSEAEKTTVKTALTAEMNAGATRVDVVLTAVAALKAIPTDDAVWGNASAAFANKVEVATYHTVEQQEPTTSLSALQGILANVDNTEASVTTAKNEIDGTVTEGTTFSLTTGVNVFDGTTGNDTFVGSIDNATPANSTLNVTDVVAGGSGTDKMQLTVSGAAAGSLPAADITSVENFFIRDVNTGGASTYDFANVTGEAQVWSDRSTQAVDFDNLGAGAVVGLQGNGSTNIGNVSFNMASATGAISIVAAGGVKGASTATAPTVTATAGTATTASLTSTGGTNVLGAVTLSGGTNTITSLSIDAQSSLVASLVAADYAATSTLNVKGAGNVTFVSNPAVFTTIAAGDLTGNLTTAINSTAAKVTTGSGNDTVTVAAALAGTAAITLGAGNDTVLAGAGAGIGSTVVVDGGTGTNTIAASLINAANAANIKNFQALDLSSDTVATGLDVELVTGSTIQSLNLNGSTTAGTAKVLNVASGVGLTVKGDNAVRTTDIGVKSAATGTSDAFTVTFAGAASASTPTAATIKAGTVLLNGVENVTVNSAGGANTWNSITLTDDKLKVLTLTGDKNLDVAFAGTNGTNPTAAGGAVSSIDGSAATGRLNINTTNVTADSAAAGLTVKGGSANDTITLVAHKATVEAGAGNDTIVTAATFGGKLTGGAGNDKFDVAASVATGTTEATAALTTITDFAVGDSVKLLTGNVLVGTTLGAKTTLGATVTNIDLALAAASLTDTANEVSWFQYGSDTYIVANDGTAGFAAGDLVVKLTGTVDLTNATLDTTTDYLTLA